jgi:hypothetical protein
LSQKRKNITLLVTLLLLSAITVLVYISGGKTNRIDVRTRLFALDENTVITTVLIEGPDVNNHFEYVGQTWMVNDKYKIDISMRDVLFAVLSQVEIRRSVPAEIRDSVSSMLKSSGIKVSILNGQEMIQEYLVGGDSQKANTYFMSTVDDVPYIMVIPGYQSYIAGIFEIKENDWRDRFIFSVNWTNLKTVRINYLEDPGQDFELRYTENFFKIDGQPDLDSAKVLDYIEELSLIQVSEFLDKSEIAKYDSLVSTSPVIRISIESIGNNYDLEFFPRLAGDRHQLARLNNTNLVLFNQAGLSPVFKKAEDFVKEDQ